MIFEAHQANISMYYTPNNVDFRDHTLCVEAALLNAINLFVTFAFLIPPPALLHMIAKRQARINLLLFLCLVGTV